MPGGAVPTLPLRADVLLSNALFEELDNGISEEFLRQHTRADDLQAVDFLELQVDAVSGAQRVEILGELLPDLRQLRLNQSYVSTLRDLGTSLSRLRVLWLCRSSLQDLGGVTAMPVLEELYVSFNDISDLSPLCTHEALQVLDLEGNLVEDAEEVEALQAVATLRELNLCMNPVWRRGGLSRERVLASLPQLEVLDDEPCGAASGAPAPRASSGTPASPTLEAAVLPESLGAPAVVPLGTAQAELEAGRELLRHSARGPAPGEPTEQELLVERVKRAERPPPNTYRMQSASARPAEAGRRPLTGFFPDRRPLTAWSSGRPTTASSGAGTTSSRSAAWSCLRGEAEAGASDLTAGDDGAPLAGNPLEAVRRRRRNVGEDEHSLRMLMRRSEAEPPETQAPEGAPRPATPDVRVGPAQLRTRGGLRGPRPEREAPSPSLRTAVGEVLLLE
mmetsp:Transcript_17023/g.49812  ORF Transcript_17023/g.49812 Transcript_17023/m.49812 type:complete len:449 (+) Transcript_17023:101-1447(+)